MFNEKTMTNNESLIDKASNDSSNYVPQMILRQQPECGRICGFTNLTDRRMLDPPLIIELQGCPTESLEIVASKYSCSLVLFDTKLKSDASFLFSRFQTDTSGQIYQNMIGPRTVTGTVLKDLDDQMKIFFVFPDLSIRVKGEYYLECRLVYVTNSKAILCLPFMETRSFQVYPPKSFPGMLESSELSTSFSDQGCSIRKRKSVLRR